VGYLFLKGEKHLMNYGVIASLGILFCYATVYPVSKTSLTEQPITLECQILKSIDGSPFVNLIEIMKFKTKIKNILTQKIAKLTFKEVISLESQLSNIERAQVLTMFIKQFVNTAKPYLEDIKIARSVISPAIQAWSMQRDRRNSLLFIFDSDEFQGSRAYEILVSSIRSLTDMDRFLEDLHLFLLDFTNSLPKSLQRYHEAELQTQN
jgi:hypothetical protein